MDIDALVRLLKEDRSHFEHRYVKELAEVKGVIDAVRAQGLRIVLTSGSFDVIHEGHSMYLEAARSRGDFLVVGVDSDSKVRERKGPARPAVPELERLRMVTHQRGVGIVTLKHPEHERWALIHAVRPDVLIATEETYSAEDIAELERTCCGKVEVLPRMATVSTSARLRKTYFEIANVVAERLPTFINNIVREIAGER
ncbi:adenylyltransferase/cytidyltransferase family protein [Kineosporia rhizophila]|uniref:adenylyltransferase/cytidyltransferase family protein n=1 Tax=Kineosporia TaxID=49184 RepID=UPI001E4E4D28|nr:MULTISPECIES: adenylyltransferase/cytidyltransferase family protein [Kineosporia]MCE0537242.1 adenylyltransferase/cytidyltransferase family protein [Kineosporia rhizophila]GLY15910.1 glycerol-3-phosphate cytidylyltransferase [Kineosporia sp. NBRC 101677]